MRDLQTVAAAAALPGGLTGGVFTALFTQARSSFSFTYPFPFPAVGFGLAWASDASTLAEEDFLRATAAFFHSHDWPIALVIISRAVWVHNNDLLLACTKVPFTYFGAQSGCSSKRLVSSP